MTALLGLMALDVVSYAVLFYLVGSAGEINPVVRAAWDWAGIFGLVLLKVPGAIGVYFVASAMSRPALFLIAASAITFVGVALNVLSLVMIALLALAQ